MEEVQALRCDDALRACKSNEFRNPQNLRFLEICGTTLEGDWQHSLLNLRWLCWHNCPENFTATNFNLQSLVILDLMESEIGDQWGGWSNIKVMNHI